MDIIEHYKQVRFRLWHGTQVAKKPDEKPKEKPAQVEEKTEHVDSQPIIVPKTTIDGLSTRRAEPIFEILDRHNVTWDEVAGQSRKQKYIPVRAEVYACLLKQGLSKAHIAKICNRDHTSVLHILTTYPNNYIQ